MARVALVTGGMGGLGESICIKLAALGYRVVTTHSPGNDKAAELEKNYLEVAISRLRRKATGAGMALPLRAVRGTGYLFIPRSERGVERD